MDLFIHSWLRGLTIWHDEMRRILYCTETHVFSSTLSFKSPHTDGVAVRTTTTTRPSRFARGCRLAMTNAPRRDTRVRTSDLHLAEFERCGLRPGGLCRLTADEIDRVNGDDGREWYIDTSFLAQHGIQEVIDCAKPGDVLWLNSTRIIQPRRRIRIFKDLEIRQLPGNDASTAQGSDTKATMVCPPDDGLFLIKSAIRNSHISILSCVM